MARVPARRAAARGACAGGACRWRGRCQPGRTATTGAGAGEAGSPPGAAGPRRREGRPRGPNGLSRQGRALGSAALRGRGGRGKSREAAEMGECGPRPGGHELADSKRRSPPPPPSRPPPGRGSAETPARPERTRRAPARRAPARSRCACFRLPSISFRLFSPAVAGPGKGAPPARETACAPEQNRGRKFGREGGGSVKSAAELNGRKVVALAGRTGGRRAPGDSCQETARRAITSLWPGSQPGAPSEPSEHVVRYPPSPRRAGPRVRSAGRGGSSPSPMARKIWPRRIRCSLTGRPVEARARGSDRFPPPRRLAKIPGRGARPPEPTPAPVHSRRAAHPVKPRTYPSNGAGQCHKLRPAAR